jgi:hypothetical protein
MIQHIIYPDTNVSELKAVTFNKFNRRILNNVLVFFVVEEYVGSHNKVSGSSAINITITEWRVNK